ncbi:DUF1552 domain-containing protein [Lignipirellula cremea]|uniref:DUF1552 domain-containing protein n=1 Tax=Lignipirellula cremea TaxID=2528010 RepID=A0A518DW04_9BACT|nr:DUF1552 domain-containing protein [Lignipirellula cremea]QDU96021.1 hypothetical protein Pla8534_38400 [Lignipirellula cremea]
MKITNSITRRTLLRGVGATMCLPLLESVARSATPDKEQPPQRMIFIGHGWGVPIHDWFPETEGADYALTRCLEPMARHRSDFSVLSNLSNKRATAGHWGCTTWLTSAEVNGSGSVKNGVSVDQLAAHHLGGQTRFPSLELSCPNEGGFGQGLSLSWSLAGSPVAGETSPIGLFDRLFGAEEVSLEQRKFMLSRDHSVLDAVMADAKAMHGKISRRDREKVEEYFQSVRDIETRLGRSEDWLDIPKPPAPFERPAGKMKTSEELTVMYDLMAAAIEADLTRVISYRQPTVGLMAEAGFKVDGHQTTHCSKDSDPYRASLAKNIKEMELLARFIDKLKNIQDVNGQSAFHNSMIAYGGGIRNGHGLRNTPTLVAGHGGGGLDQGRHYVYTEDHTPLANLWLSMLRQTGIQVERFADSDGSLPGLFSV